MAGLPAKLFFFFKPQNSKELLTEIVSIRIPTLLGFMPVQLLLLRVIINILNKNVKQPLRVQMKKAGQAESLNKKNQKDINIIHVLLFVCS